VQVESMNGRSASSIAPEQRTFRVLNQVAPRARPARPRRAPPRAAAR